MSARRYLLLFSLVGLINTPYVRAVTPDTIELTHCMKTISYYCLDPQGYKAPGGQLFDKAWCPTWHTYVMSPPTLEEAPLPVLTEPTNEVGRLPEDDDMPKTSSDDNTLEIPLRTDIDPLLKQQVYYAAEVGQKIIYLLSIKDTDATAEMTLQAFLEHFLYDSEPWIKTIYYDLVNNYLIIVMQESETVMPLLKGAEIIVDIDPALPACGGTVTEATTDTVAIPPTLAAKTAPIKPNFLDALQCMGTLTAHCYHPQKHDADPDKWSENEWCPLWHAYVMFP